MTEATSDESDADPDSCIGPVLLRREETMVGERAGAVPSYKREETVRSAPGSAELAPTRRPLKATGQRELA